MTDFRKARRSGKISTNTADLRDEFQHDRDRVIHSTALRRLEEVSQVVSPVEGHAFHNRLTHTLKVAQIGRRIAENIQKQADKDPAIQALADRLGGLNAEVVEAASLAHDLGHPPFGHFGEKVLDRLVRSKGNTDGYEGNAQSFRIITKLATRNPDVVGLDLTRATLRALLKYPWVYDNSPGIDKIRGEKWGAYQTEIEELRFAQELPAIVGPEKMTLEAAIMDLADDIAYAIHDVEDFYRVGLIPLHSLFTGFPNPLPSREAQDFIEKVCDWREREDSNKIKSIFENHLPLFFFGMNETYHGTRQEKTFLRFIASQIISNYVDNVRINPNVERDATNERILILDDGKDLLLEIKILKDMTRYYVHRDRALVTQQRGERTIIENLFEYYFEAATAIPEKDWWIWEHILPPDYWELYKEESKRQLPKTIKQEHALHARIVADVISMMTDKEASSMYSRLSGHSLGSILDDLSTA